MVDREMGPPVVGLPERLDRRMRLGPFPSSRDALKFVAYAATGALLVPFTSSWVLLLAVTVGFSVSVWRPDGQALDERALRLVSWKLRSLSPGNTVSDATPHPLVRQGLLELAPHRYVAVVRTGGTPIAYLPPAELAQRFDRYRELLRSTESSFALLATTAPIRGQAVRPGSFPRAGAEARALSGYRELVSLLCRRRLLRRVYIVLGTTETGAEAVSRLEGRVTNLIERLGALGLRPVRLRDRGLAEAARRFGWAAGVRRS